MTRQSVTAVLAAVFLAACADTRIKSGEAGADGDATSAQASFADFSYQGSTVERVQVGAGEYRNPILAGYYPDPSLTRVGETFYLVNSSFAHYPGLPIFQSSDLVNWRQIANAINRPEQFDFSGLRVSRGIFAPDISFHDGRYYLVSTCVDCGGNFVMTAEDAAGPWSDPTWFGFEGIDPSIFWEDDKAYILNNGAPDEPPRYEGHRAIWIQEFDWRNLQMVGERKQLINGGVDLSKQPIWIEGPHLFKRGDHYYITAAEGGTSVQHSQTIFRAQNPWGPFTPAAHNPILTQRDLDPARSNPVSAAGHAKFVRLDDGSWWATFLATRPYADDFYNIGRETFLLPVTWQDDWPHILEPGEKIPYVHRKPDLRRAGATTPTTGDFGYTETFDAPLGMPWVGVRTPRESFHRVGGGSLHLNCGAPFGELAKAPAFIGRRQQHHIAEVSTTLIARPQNEGGKAGIAALQNDTSLVFFGIERREGRDWLVVFVKEAAPRARYIAERRLGFEAPLTLSVSLDKGSMAFRYKEGDAWQTLARDADATVLSTFHAGGFVGTVVGLYCSVE